MNFPTADEATYGHNARQLYKDNYVIYFWADSGNNDLTWIPDFDYRLKSVNVVHTISTTESTYAELRCPDFVGRYFQFAHTNTDAITKYYTDNFNFNDIILAASTPVRFYAQGATTNNIMMSLHLELLENMVLQTLPVSGKYYYKCGILDWLRGECIHGIV